MRSLAEWLAALGVLAGTAWIGVPLLRQLTPLASTTVTLVESSLPELPRGVPAGAQSVPFLILLDGTAVRLGMAETVVLARPFSRWAAGPAVAAEGVFDRQMIRPFQSGSTRFWLVLDRTARGREREVTAIFVR